ncbi:recombinase RecT, partial [Salmonella enterica]|nr:recombinase RecT [Salmonella enterica]EGR8820239.1 recombinase RecT [Salmonella enterica]
RGWTDEDEIGLFVQVGAILRGESEITWGEPLYLSGVVTRNSPLWVSNPKQQIAYLGVKYWARLYCPEVILGVYSPDEIEEREEKIINPVQNAQNITMQDITADTPQTSSTQIAGADTDAVADEFRTRINSAETLEDATAVGNDINSAKPTLGTALFTELKNKATRRYHLVKHRNLVETAINAIPRPGEPESVAGFEAAEKVLTAAKRHIGDELYDKYRITLDDMKPEYIG